MRTEDDIITWDWREQPDWKEINEDLKAYGVQIVNIDTHSDQFGVRMMPIEP